MRTPMRDNLRILVVEDDEANRMAVKIFLKNQPYVLEDAANGEEAVAAFVSRPFDIVLMDIQMPVMDGYTATRKIREWETAQRKSFVPIIACTAMAGENAEEISLEAGCSFHIRKPFSRQALLDAILRFAP
jgi:CheY-like chemotaxis protein